ncbi:MAG: hypothetical protein BalsKO_15350 [Balneolaceae bacterium]
MLTKKPTSLLAIALLIVASACAQQEQTPEVILDGDIITASDQAALTPEAILQGLKDGNARFINNDLTNLDYKAQIAATATGQFPEAVILSCID